MRQSNRHCIFLTLLAFLSNLQINRHRDEIQDLERQLSEKRQNVIVLEGTMEQVQETNEHLQEQLDTYKQKYDESTEQISHLEATFSKVQEQLAESRNRVRLQHSCLILKMSSCVLTMNSKYEISKLIKNRFWS